MDIVVRPNAEAAAQAAADRIAQEITDTLSLREHAAIALSGGVTPRPMFDRLSQAPVPWDRVHIFQVDERAAPAGDAARNWTSLHPLTRLVPPTNQHPMPVEVSDADLEYRQELAAVVGRPPVLDVVHLGIGADGHTASLIPGDPILEVTDQDVSWVKAYRGHRRLSLTISALSRARTQVWLVCGEEKSEIVDAVVENRSPAPASLVLNRSTAALFLDASAARHLSVN